LIKGKRLLFKIDERPFALDQHNSRRDSAVARRLR